MYTETNTLLWVAVFYANTRWMCFTVVRADEPDENQHQVLLWAKIETNLT